MNHQVQMNSPIGVLTIECSDDAITHIELPGGASNGRRPETERPETERPATEPGNGGLPAPLAAAVAQLEEYFAGRRHRFDLPLELDGTDFQRSVWLGLAEIPYGKTVSYAELAAMVGRPHAYRAVGQANGSNPIPIVLPCHRVVASGGGLGGYGGGLPMKRQLLALEGLDFG
jgi:methylated-DNA-[protein]-cysteine S-methyltransferase